MLTTYCHTCGKAKDPKEYAAPECGECTAHRNELREYVVKENAKIEAANVERNKRGEPPMPFLDASAVIREGMHSRGTLPTATHADPRTGFVPVVSRPSMVNLGMDAHIPPSARVFKPGAPAPELPPDGAK